MFWAIRHKFRLPTVRSKLFAIGLALLPFFCFGQTEKEKSSLIEQRIETLVETLDEDAELDYTTLFDDLLFFLEHPLNLNTADEGELRQLHLLSDFEIQALVSHREQHGPLYSVFELQAVNGWTVQTIRNIEPFVTVKEQEDIEQFKLQNLLSEGQSDLFLRYTTVLEEQEGYSAIDPDELAENPNRRYLGSQERYYLRYRYKFRQNISFGLTGEKDPGEEFLAGTPKGFDFYSAHLQYRGKGAVRNVILGDFQAQFGQGLTMWSGLAFGKSSYALQVKKVPSGLRPYTSVDENLFMRGAAATVGFGKFELTALFSRKGVDANLQVPDPLDPEQIASFTSLQQSGFHRTPGELLDKDAIEETHIGGNLSFDHKRVHLGVSGFQADYGGEFKRNLNYYNQFELDTSTYSVVGVDYSFSRSGWNFFGETSRSDNGGLATLNGLMLAVDPRLSISIVQRSFDRNFQNLQANVFAESSRPSNESGIYIGAEATLSQKLRLTAYYDQYKFAWLRFLNDAPTAGSEYLAQLTLKPSRANEFYVRYRNKLKARNAINDEIIDYPLEESRQYFRIHAQYKVSESFRFKTRAEWSRYQLGYDDPQNGFMFYHDVIFKKIEWPVSFSLRYALFDTDTYNARIYAYENDLLYTWSIPAYSGVGSRAYAMVKWRVYRKVDLWVRYSIWDFTDRETISSGLEEIQGNQKSELKMQLRWRF